VYGKAGQRWDGWARNAKETLEELDVDLEYQIPLVIPPGGCSPAVDEEQEEAQEELENQLSASQ
jgi:hypothetical protein